MDAKMPASPNVPVGSACMAAHALVASGDEVGAAAVVKMASETVRAAETAQLGLR